MRLFRILCPIDFSFHSDVANFYASVFAQSFDAEIIYLNVNWPPNNSGPIEDRLDDLYSRLSTQVRPFVHDVRHRFEVRDGEPASQILKLAEDLNVDLIIMGTHGKTGSAKLLHGSVCEKVLRKSEFPVMAVKSTNNMQWIFPAEREAANSSRRK